MSYNGKDYHGWQSQPKEKSVQEELETALSTLLKKKIKVTGCGRTDTGVHAEQYFLHFDLDQNLNRQQFKHRLNSYLPPDIVIFDIRQAKEEAHARFGAISRSYEYRIFLGKTAFGRGEICQLPIKELDVEAMNEASALLLKYTDFKCFCNKATERIAWLDLAKLIIRT